MRIKRIALLVGLALCCGGTHAARAAPCITIVTHEDDRLSFRNACAVCKRAVWSWGAGQSVFSRDGTVEGVWRGGRTWTRTYRVPAHAGITVRAPTGKLLREDPCPAAKR